MALFQKSVVNKYLKQLDEEVVMEAYAKFQDYFHNPATQKNIREAKEEQFQQKFLMELFVNILGYTIFPDENHNLTTEFKNENGAKKADGAILDDGNAIGVIELKGTDTKNLDKINAQAFNYKNNQSHCVYVITSNFEKLRFFIHDAVNHEEFNLFKLTEDEFRMLWLCLHKEMVFQGVPVKMKEESVLEEEKVTKQLYADYSIFKKQLWQNMVKNHPETDPLFLYKKSQKLLDRFLFIFFAEDKGLLPPNSISKIVEQWEKLKDLDEYKPLFERFKKYFGYLNKGWKGKEYEIFAYNGGLFAEDKMLDSINIDDDVLHPHVMKLTAYDFASDVDVNILGHIFEHSLSEIENITAELEGRTVEKSKTKRKKDGVYYTPKYITKYIVDNTVGKLCEEKKVELGITEERFAEAGRRTRKGIKDLEDYRKWLIGLSICDPACGSGAFLNQALEFLLAEHKWLDELLAEYHGASLVLSDIESQILENNLYGVDVNEESVEIAKLALWLRTAHKGRKLTSLSNHIKCGNSLIDDPKVVGEKAFNWGKEFPEIFTEKDKKAFHITTATHDSRTSQRMIDHKVRLRRDNGRRPGAEPIWLDAKGDEVITETVAEIVKEDGLNVMAYNICNDHMHLLLVCEKEEVPKIMQKIKSVTAKQYNRSVEKTVATATTREHAPLTSSTGEEKEKHVSLWTQKFGCNAITSESQLRNTVDYIEGNRVKHKLPDHSSGTLSHIRNICCSQEHAFRPEYKGGFDVVIGNPPYVRQEMIDESQKKYFQGRYEQVWLKAADLYVCFYQKGLELLKPNKARFGFITPNKFIRSRYGQGLRKFLALYQIQEIIDFGELPVFQDAATFPCVLIISNYQCSSATRFLKIDKLKELDLETKMTLEAISLARNAFDTDNWKLADKEEALLLEKLQKTGIPLGENYKIRRGLITGFNEAFIIDEETKRQLLSVNPNAGQIIKRFAVGDNVRRFHLQYQDLYLLLTKNGSDVKQYSAVYEHLSRYEDQLQKRWDKGDHWYELRACDYYEEFDKPKIVYPDIAKESRMLFDQDGTYFGNTAYFIPTTDTWLLAILNSKLIFYYYKHNATVLGNADKGGRLRWFTQDVKNLPIANANEKTMKGLGYLVLNSSNASKKLYDLRKKLITYIGSDYHELKATKKLKGWDKLQFSEFIKELNMAIKKAGEAELTKASEIEWMEVFEDHKERAQELQVKIDKTDREIDRMIYDLYGLTEDEIKIIEGA